MRTAVFEFLLNFLLGAAWVMTLAGAALLFFVTYHVSGFFAALLAAFFGALPGFFAVVLLEAVAVLTENRYKLRKQQEIIARLQERMDRAGLPD